MDLGTRVSILAFVSYLLAGCANLTQSAADAATMRQALYATQKFARQVPPYVPVPPTWDGAVRYYGGVSHSLYGVVVHGHNHGERVGEQPRSASAHRMFYFDSQERLRFIVRSDGDGGSQVESLTFYRHGRPLARATYSSQACRTSITSIMSAACQPWDAGSCTAARQSSFINSTAMARSWLIGRDRTNAMWRSRFLRNCRSPAG